MDLTGWLEFFIGGLATQLTEVVELPVPFVSELPAPQPGQAELLPDLARAAEADGVHLGADDLPVTQARVVAGHGSILGATALAG